MKKKYIMPSIDTIQMQTSKILCGSGEETYEEVLIIDDEE